MSKAGNKLLAAAAEALAVSICKHDLVEVSRRETTGGTVITTECRHCHARFTTYELPKVSG